MRILQIAAIDRRVPPLRYGGIERIVHWLTGELVRKGHEVTLLAAGGSQASCRVVPLSEQPLADDHTIGGDPKQRDIAFTVAVAEAARIMLEETFDVVHNHLGWRLLPYSFLCPGRFVTTLQTPLDTPSKSRAFAASGGAPVICVSDAQRNGAPGMLNCVATVHNGVPVQQYSLGTGNGGYLAFLGRMAPEKGVCGAIKMARAVRKPLLMAAAVHPWERAFYDEQVKPELDGKSVVHVGEITDAEKGRFLGDAEALLAPVLWEEPCSIACIEAMACGTPVITINRGGMRELVADGVTGILGESVEQLIERYGEVAWIDRAVCRERAKELFSVECMTEAYLEVYHRYVGGAALYKDKDGQSQ